MWYAVLRGILNRLNSSFGGFKKSRKWYLYC